MKHIFAGMVVALACLAGVARAAHAQEGVHLDRALKLIEELDYDGALAELEAALESGANNAYELQLIYRLTGEVHAAYGRPGEAERAFRVLLVLDPAAELADGVAPKIKAPFERAQNWVNDRGILTVRFDHAVQGNEHVFTLVNEKDPLRLVAGMRASYTDRTGGSRRVGSTPARPLMVGVPGRVSGEVALYAIDRWGNELLTQVVTVDETDAAPASVSSRSSRPEAKAKASRGEGRSVPLGDDSDAPRPRSRSFLGHWAVWGGLAVVAGATGTWLHVSAAADQDSLVGLVADSSNHEYAEARDLEARANRKLLWSNISLGAGAALAVTSVVLIVRDVTADEPPPRRRVEMVGSVGGGGASMGVRVAF